MVLEWDYQEKIYFFYYPNKGGTLSSFMGSAFISVGIVVGIIGEKIMNPGQYTLQKGLINIYIWYKI